MNITETRQILDRAAAIDNRKITPETIDAWHEIIGAVPFDIAKEALKLAQQDASVKYLEPRHIMGWAKEAAFRLDKEKPKVQENITGDPMPTCRDHNKSIFACDPCCHRLYKWKEANGSEGLHQFAKTTIYA